MREMLMDSGCARQCDRSRSRCRLSFLDCAPSFCLSRCFNTLVTTYKRYRFLRCPHPTLRQSCSCNLRDTAALACWYWQNKCSEKSSFDTLSHVRHVYLKLKQKGRRWEQKRTFILSLLNQCYPTSYVPPT